MTGADILGYIILIAIIVLCIYVYFENYGEFQLKCIVSDEDGHKYCVRERSKIQKAANLLAKVTNKLKQLVQYLHKKYPEQDKVKRLVENFNPKKIMETLPTSDFTAYSENKGEKIAFCLNKDKHNNEDLIDEKTLTFVAIHELAHVASKSIGHKSEFWENFKFLLENAEEAGIHSPVDYKNNPQEYCGMKIHDNPYYDI
tara:strand:+ start:2329 stop:2928 length:600 start_codon:yes stop_codon:yes gene_type:complete